MTAAPPRGGRDRTYAAKLLFQSRAEVHERSDKRRLCEVRIVRFQARSGKEALAAAKRRGRSAQHSYRNVHGDRVHFEFIGVMDLLYLDSACEQDEVWWEWTLRLAPMERKEKLIPPDSKLLSRLPDQ
jgi:hypothetical protein